MSHTNIAINALSSMQGRSVVVEILRSEFPAPDPRRKEKLVRGILRTADGRICVVSSEKELELDPSNFLAYGCQKDGCSILVSGPIPYWQYC